MLKLTDLVVKPVRIEVAGANQELYVRTMTIGDLDRVSEQPEGAADRYCFLAEKFLCDEQGTLLVNTDEDRAHLRNLPMSMVREIVHQGLAVNSLDSSERAQEAEEEAKKS